jgi:diguanylate cyclase (GGDEF)-like protein
VVAASENPMLHDLLVDLNRYPEIQRALQSGEALLVREARSDPVYQGVEHLATTSALVLPFSLRGERAGAFFLRTGEGDPPLGDADLRFARQVIETAATAIEKAMEVEETIRREEAVRQQSETDPLTGLVNRRALGDRLGQEVERATRYGTVLSCIMIDLDHFKAINDAHGAEAGDQVLIQFGELLRGEQRTVDTVVRYGGEEFVVLLPETGRSGARLFAERILRRVSHARFGGPAAPIALSISLGLATFPDERAADAESLLRLADRNLLRAKSDGGSRYRD